MGIVLAIDGHDGAAKTPIVARLSHQFSSHGLSTSICAPFQIANNRLGRDIYPLWASDPKTAVSMLQDIIVEAYTNLKTEVLLFDRHWPTILVEVAGTPLEAEWFDFVPVIYARTTFEHLQRSSRYSPNVPWTASAKVYESYQHRYDSIMAKYAQHLRRTITVLDMETNLETPIQQIVSEILKS